MEPQLATNGRKRKRGRPQKEPFKAIKIEPDIEGIKIEPDVGGIKIEPENFRFPPAFIPKRKRTETFRSGTKTSVYIDHGGYYFVECHFQLDKPVELVETLAEEQVEKQSSSVSSNEEAVELGITVDVEKQVDVSSNEVAVELGITKPVDVSSKEEAVELSITVDVKKQVEETGLEHDDRKWWTSSWFEDDTDIASLLNPCYDANMFEDIFIDQPFY